MTTLAVATEAGFFLVEETSGTWKVVHATLDGCEVLALAREPEGAVLAASRGRGLYRVDPRTLATERIGEDTLPDKLHAVTVSMHDPARIYVGTEPADIFVSNDGGRSFRSLESVARLNRERAWTYPIPSIATHIRAIVVDADDPRRLYAAAQVGGFIRSENEGASWEVNVDELDPDVHAILQHPVRRDLLFAVCGGGGGGGPGDPAHRTGRPIYRSTDRGTSWTCVSGGFPRTYGAPVAAVQGPHPILIAGVARGIPPSWRKRPERADAAVMISEDDGDTWRSASGSIEPQPKMFEAVAVDAAHGSRVFLGTGSDVARDPSGEAWTGELYCSANFLGPWERVPVRLPGIAALLPL
jgi:hypothetical protein